MSDVRTRLTAIAARLAAVSAAGQEHPTTVYERDNFREVGALADRLEAMVAGGEVDNFRPIEAPLPANRGPATVGDAAIFDEAGRLLLIRRADNKKWAMPGGALEVGETAAEGVVREAQEETGVVTIPVALIAVHDSGLWSRQPVIRLFHNLFLCEPRGTVEVYHPQETVGQGWFAADELPEPLDPGHVRRIAAAFAFHRGERKVDFE